MYQPPRFARAWASPELCSTAGASRSSPPTPSRLLLVAERAALLPFQLGDGVVGLALPLVAEALVEHQRKDVVLVVLPRGLPAQNVSRAPEMGFELLESELHSSRSPLFDAGSIKAGTELGIHRIG